VAVHSNYSGCLNAGTFSTYDEAKLQKVLVTHYAQAAKAENNNFISPFRIRSSISISVGYLTFHATVNKL
jgi:hypothetical protein